MNDIKFSWKRTKDHDSSYGSVMHKYLSAYRTTLKEIKEFAQEMVIQNLCKLN